MADLIGFFQAVTDFLKQRKTPPICQITKYTFNSNALRWWIIGVDQRRGFKISHFIESTNKLSHRIRFFQKRNSIYIRFYWTVITVFRRQIDTCLSIVSQSSESILICNFTKFNRKPILTNSNENSQDSKNSNNAFFKSLLRIEIQRKIQQSVINIPNYLFTKT